MERNNKAFTLIELSIVLIVIGLIIGAIVAAQELITQAKIRRLVSDINNIQTSVNTFKIKYNFLPGDFPNAGSIWSVSGCSDLPTPGCNGNGNWQLDYNYSYGDGEETYRFWQHLSLAGLTSKKYTGRLLSRDQFQSSWSDKVFIGTMYNSPFSGKYKNNYFQIGAWYAYYATAGAFTPIDAYAIDLKIDDGIANSGKLFGIDGWDAPSGACSYDSSAIPGNPLYNISGTQGLYCRLQKTID